MQVGDTVRFLNAKGGGRISRLEGKIAYVEDDDGFEMPVMTNELIVVSEAKKYAVEADDKPDKTTATTPAAATQQPQAPIAPDDIEEVEGGDILNVTMAFEPHDIKRLSATTWDAVLVNDSNYYLSFVWLSRTKDATLWTLRRQGLVEPNYQLVMEELVPEDWTTLDRMCLQFIAFKQDKPFALQAPVQYERRLDVTKAYKLHCYQPNAYFDGPVLAYEIVCDGRNVQAQDNIVEQKITLLPKSADRRPVTKRPLAKSTATSPLVVDLHASELLDNTHGLSNADILNRQIDRFREVMDANLRHPATKIVFIHGKGNGVLRQAILKELNYRYKGHRWQDASFQEYGFGATQVTIATNPPATRQPGTRK